MDVEDYEWFVERFRVVPAVDVEELRASLAHELLHRKGRGSSFAVGFGPSLLGTLDMDALPVGMHPYVDPDRVIRPLRDDVVLFSVGDDPDRRERLATTLAPVGRFEAPLVLTPLVMGGVLVLCVAEWADEARSSYDVEDRIERAERSVPLRLKHLAGNRTLDGAVLGADLYVLLPRDALAQVLAPRDG